MRTKLNNTINTVSKFRTEAFCTAWGLYLVFFMLVMVTFSERADFVIDTLTGHAYHVAYALLAVIILINLIEHEYSKAAVAFFASSLVLLVLIYLNTGFKIQIVFLAFIMASFGLDGRTIIKETCIIKIAVLLPVTLLALSGIIPDYISEADRTRHYLGFDYTTMPAMIALSFSAEYAWLRNRKITCAEILLLAVLNGVYYYYTETKMILALAILLTLIMAKSKASHFKWEERNNKGFLLLSVPLMCCIVAIAVTYLYSPQIELFSKLDTVLSTRLTLGKEALSAYGIGIFGKNITMVGMANLSDGTYNYVDSSFVQLLLTHGPLFLVYSVLLYMKGIDKARKNRDVVHLAVIMLALIYAITDPQLMTLGNTCILLTFFSEETPRGKREDISEITEERQTEFER